MIGKEGKEVQRTKISKDQRTKRPKNQWTKGARYHRFEHLASIEGVPLGPPGTVPAEGGVEDGAEAEARQAQGAQGGAQGEVWKK